MTDTRSRHVPLTNAAGEPIECGYCAEDPWPCDAIREADEAAAWRAAAERYEREWREQADRADAAKYNAAAWWKAWDGAADRADKLLARCQELAEQVDELGAEVVEQSDRADKAEAERVAAQDIAIGAQEAEGRAEAALAARTEEVEGLTRDLIAENATSAQWMLDAKALAEAVRIYTDSVDAWNEVPNRVDVGAVKHAERGLRAVLAAHKEATE